MYDKEFLNKIKEDMKNCNFENLTRCSCYWNVIRPLRDCGYRFGYNTGASKLVLIFDYKNFVLKIPFMGYDSEDYDQWEIEDYGEDYEYSSYCRFAEADSENGWDYCEMEAKLYEEAKTYGVSVFFLETKKIFEVNGFPIYIQPFMSGDLDSDYEWDDTKSSVSNMNITRKITRDQFVLNMSAHWASKAVSQYGLKKFKKLLNFIEDFDIEDLHSSNIGYMKNGNCRIIDYCGFKY